MNQNRFRFSQEVTRPRGRETRAFLLSFVCVSLMVMMHHAPTSASSPKIGGTLVSTSSKNMCTGGPLPACNQEESHLNTQGSIDTGYFLYFLVLDGNPETGIAGAIIVSESSTQIASSSLNGGSARISNSRQFHGHNPALGSFSHGTHLRTARLHPLWVTARKASPRYLGTHMCMPMETGSSQSWAET